MNIVCVGAHPDDAEWYAGGSMVYWVEKGHTVYAVSVTNGDIGHHIIEPEELAQIRRIEAQESAKRGGYKSIILDFPDGSLMPSLEARKTLVKLLRELKADVVLTHRPVDYHPDHRACGILIQDSAFLVTVPHFCPETPSLKQSPICLYMMDIFRKPLPFTPDFAVDITNIINKKWELLDAMTSQMYEWLPWLDGQIESVPNNPEERKKWLMERWDALFRMPSIYYRSLFENELNQYKESFEYVEFFEQCEYGRPPARTELESLFTLIRQGQDRLI
ncbi:MAG TPA: PIG-L family deacetylase [Candidatus Hydrogenedens sp.]|nr:PIG-L family deacetylase [Candidatus Hydrogenedens sp.]HOK10553.1 PIG-L family deacetylase [Candidatus Hydrogenedens sp.]HOL18994.1 PIG-L family deacetylase [Candidatus Hydrogenedens sp.]HPP58954.1 PIG-L family deacetylase [Candidatus Hydrogenedens sp.]